MNTERLHSIIRAIRDDLAATEAVELLDQLTEALQRQTGDPATASHQQDVGRLRQELATHLTSSASNAFSPVWRQTLKELGIEDLLGTILAERIEEIFARNQITPQIALDEIQPIDVRITELRQAVDQLIAGFEWLGIPTDELAAGEFQVGTLIPRGAVRDELRALGRELEELNKIFLPFAELAEGSRPEFVVKTISSSDFGVFLLAVPPVATAIAIAVERVIGVYKKLLEVRLLRAQLKEQGVSDENLAGISEHADTTMTAGIDEIVQELFDQFGSDRDAGRRNELTIEVRYSLNAIANRIDAGYNIEVVAGPPEDSERDASESEDGAATGDPERIRAAEFREMVVSRSEGMRFINPTGQAILSLPESTGNGDEADVGEPE